MKNVIPLSLLVLLPSLGCATVPRQDSAGGATSVEPARPNRVSLLVGERSLDSDDWGSVDDQTTVALGFETPFSTLPLELELGLAHSEDESGPVDAETTEGSAGVRATFLSADDQLHPYIGGGLSRIRAEIDTPGTSDDDSSFGVYAHGGLLYDLTPEWHVGFDLRFLFGSDLDLAGSDTDADYTQLGVLVGYSF